jgi:hypothetical protein
VSTTVSNAIDVGAFDSTTDRLLAVMQLARMAGQDWMSAVELSKALQMNHGRQLHWRTIDAELNGKRELVARRKRRGRWEYSILAQGSARVAAAPQTVAFIDPVNALQATRKLHDILSQLAGTVRICDAYLDNATFEHLEACPQTADIRLLTMNVKDSGPLRRLVGAARSAGYRIEIKVVGNRVLHDRYVLDDTQMLILGTSLNGFSKKQSFVINAGGDVRATMEREFDTLWATASAWP